MTAPRGGEAEATPPGGTSPAGASGGEEPAPVGTLFILLLYLMLLAGMWGTMYWILLSR